MRAPPPSPAPVGRLLGGGPESLFSNFARREVGADDVEGPPPARPARTPSSAGPATSGNFADPREVAWGAPERPPNFAAQALAPTRRLGGAPSPGRGKPGR